MCVCIYFRSKAQSNFIRKFKFELWSTLELPVYKEVSETSAEHLHLCNITHFLYFNPYACVHKVSMHVVMQLNRSMTIYILQFGALFHICNVSQPQYCTISFYLCLCRKLSKSLGRTNYIFRMRLVARPLLASPHPSRCRKRGSCRIGDHASWGRRPRELSWGRQVSVPLHSASRPVPFRSVNFTESDRWFSPGW